MESAELKRPTLAISQLLAVVAGNALEFYDFLTFSFFAVQIGQTFFPGGDSTTSLLKSLAVFGIGFTTRPLGGALIGPLGDRIGRKPAMLFCFGLMGVSMLGLAITPGYAVIGVAAPVIVVMLRLAQGFALGGEVGPATAFLMEAAPADKRGLYVALQSSTQFGANLLTGLIGLALANLLPPAAFGEWGWRIALLLGVAVVPFALAIRRRLPETLHVESGPAPARLARGQLVLGLMGIAMLGGATIATYVTNYMNVFATHTLGMPVRLGFAATAASGLCGVVSTLCSGALSDRIGRKPVMMGGSILLAVAAPVLFLALTRSPDVMTLVLVSGGMALILGTVTPVVLAALSESLPTALRSGSLGIVYAVAITSFGGSAQFMVTWLIGVLHSPLAPAWYMAGALLMGLLGMIWLKESAPIKSKEVRQLG